MVFDVTDVRRVIEASADTVRLFACDAGELEKWASRVRDGWPAAGAAEINGRWATLTWRMRKQDSQDFLRECIAGIMGEGGPGQGVWAGTGGDRFTGQFSEGEVLLGHNAAGKLRGYYSCQYVGELLQDDVPVPLYKIGASPGGSSGNTEAVGREEEIQKALAHASARRETNRPAVICIHGEPGIGKTQAGAALCREMGKACGPCITDRYYQGGRGADKFSAISARGKDLGSRLAALENYIRNEGDDGLWWLDDVHWAPSRDRALLRELAASLGLRTTVILTLRPEAEATLAGHASLNLYLKPFTAAQTAELVRKVSGHPPEEGTLRAILASSAGSPLMIREFVASALSAGTLRVVKGKLTLKHGVRRAGNALQLRQIVENTLHRLPAKAAEASKALAVVRGGIAESEVAGYLRRCGAAPLSNPGDLAPYFTRVGSRVECRHELIREALLSLLPQPAEKHHRAAMDYHKSEGDWIEAYRHACQLDDTHGEKRATMLVNAFHQAWKSSLLKQCEKFGHDIDKKQLPLASTAGFAATMGKVFYRLGKMRECASWMQRASVGSLRCHWLGVASYLFRPLRGTAVAEKYRMDGKRLADTYHLQADAHWTFRELRASAASLLKAASVTGSMAYPNAERSEAQAGLAIILSATPMKRLCRRFVANSLREAAAAGVAMKEMRARMLCAIALLGTDHWQEAVAVCEPAHRWAAENGEVKLQLQAGLPLTAALSFLNERDRANALADKQMRLAARSQDEYLMALTRGVKAALALNEESAAAAARILHGMPEIAAVATEQAMLGSVLRYLEEDDEGALEQLAKLQPLLNEGPPGNYGISTLFDLPLSASLGLWGRGMLPWRNVRAVLKAFKRQAGAFVVARPLYTAWKGVADYCVKGNRKDLRHKLGRAMDGAVRHGFKSHGSTVAALASAFAVEIPTGFPEFKGERERLRQMKQDIDHRAKQ